MAAHGRQVPSDERFRYDGYGSARSGSKGRHPRSDSRREGPDTRWLRFRYLADARKGGDTCTRNWPDESGRGTAFVYRWAIEGDADQCAARRASFAAFSE